MAPAAVASIPSPAFFEEDFDVLALFDLPEGREAAADLEAEAFSAVRFPVVRDAVEPEAVFAPVPVELLPALLDLVEPPELDRPADCFAPPDAVRFPAAPLLVPVDVLDPPRAEAVEALAVPPLEPDLFAVVEVFDAPVLELLELFAAELLFEPPVFAVADLPLPLFALRAAVLDAAVFLLATDDAADLGFLPDPLPDPEVDSLVFFAVAMSMYSHFSELKILNPSWVYR